jgi:hypothetical protein
MKATPFFGKDGRDHRALPGERNRGRPLALAAAPQRPDTRAAPVARARFAGVVSGGLLWYSTDARLC